MQKSKPFPILIGQLRPVRSRFLQQTECSIYVGADEIVRTTNGAIDMAFRRKMNDSLRTPALE